MTWSNPCPMWRRQDAWRSFNLSCGRFPVTRGKILYNIAQVGTGIGRAMSRWLISNLLFSAALAIMTFGASALEAPPLRHGIAMHGEPALTSGFEHLPYASPQAPKGGRIALALQGTFDSLNPLI